MKIQMYEDIAALRKAVHSARKAGKRIGFVPTMGYLHAGHLSLVDQARKESDYIVVSIFVNPSQFNNPNDLKTYPRDIPRDCSMLEGRNVDAVFLPTPELMYPAGFESWLELSDLPKPFEGAHRPGHFRGVSTVVAMLFNIVQPDAAVFGEKDFQQLRIIERMVEDFKFPVKIIRGTLVREGDGLAMSSRNVRLSPAARKAALAISAGLFAAEKACAAGEKRSKFLCALVAAALEKAPGIKTEYISVADEEKLSEQQIVSRPCRLLIAAEVGGVRLIDNVPLRG